MMVQMRAEKELADSSSQDLSPVPVVDAEPNPSASNATQPPQSTPSQSPARVDTVVEKQRTHRTRASGDRERKKRSQPSKMEY